MGEDINKTAGEGGYVIGSQRMRNYDGLQESFTTENCKLQTNLQNQCIFEGPKSGRIEKVLLLTALPKAVG